jgi:hypothetical protein
MQEIVQISREHQAADDGVTKVTLVAMAIFVAVVGCINPITVAFPTLMRRNKV